MHRMWANVAHKHKISETALPSHSLGSSALTDPADAPEGSHPKDSMVKRLHTWLYKQPGTETEIVYSVWGALGSLITWDIMLLAGG